MGIETIIGMIPKGGKYAQSVVNFVRKAPEHWGKFKEAIKQIDDLLKIGRLRLDGKQKTIFETNKNILKNHEKVTKKVEVPPVKKEDMFKGWTPTVVERQNLRNVYKKLPDKEGKLPTYTKEMEAIDEELNELMIYQEGKYKHLEPSQKEALYEKLQAQMEKLMAESTTKDLSKLSLSQINKKSQSLQKRIREIKDNPDIKGTVTEGPKADMIDAIYKSENAALTEARNITTRNKNLKKYGDKFPRLDPENDAFIILKLDKSGNTMRVGRWSRRFGATKDKTTGELTRQEGTAYWDKWDSKTGKLREEGKEVWHETVDAKGKTIMSNPEYKIPKTENMELQTELYTNLSTSDLAKKGYKLKDIDMIMKGREVRKYLETQEAAEKGLDTGIKMHERTNTNEITNIMEDLYFKGDDVYKMSIEEWTKKIPEYFAEGGRTGFHRGSLRHQKTHDFRAYEKPSDFFGPSPPENWVSRLLGQERDIYLPERDALESFMKERFMYGEQDSPPNVFKQIWLDIQKLLDKKRNKHATGGISNLFQERQGYSRGKAVELITKLPEFLKFVERLLIKASNEIRQGIGKWRGLDDAQKMAQHENLAKLATEFQKTKKFDVRINEYTGIDAEKAFIEARAKVKSPVKKDRKLTKDELDDLYEEFDEALPYPMETVGDKEKFLKAVKDEEAYMFQQYKKGNLDPVAGDKSPARKRFLEKKLEDAELSGDKRLITRDEIEELSSFDLGTEMEKVKSKGKIWKSSEGETQGIATGFDEKGIKALDQAMKKGMALTDAMKTLNLNPASSKDYFKFEKLVSEGMIGFSKEMKEQIIRAKYGDVVNKELLDQMLVDTNPQRLSEVMGTIDEGVIMHERGMGTDEIINTLKESFTRKKQATGGLIPGYATGGVSNLFRSR